MRSGEVVDHRGQTLRLDRPLDFLAITDHAEQMGVGRDLYDESTPVGKSDLGRRFRERLSATTDELRALFQSRQPIPGVDTGPTVREAWQREMEAAGSHYRLGSFSGVDPFAFGVVGASDVHNGWSDPREET